MPYKPSQASLAAANTYEEKIDLFLDAANEIAKDMQNHVFSNKFSFEQLNFLKSEITQDLHLSTDVKTALLAAIVQVYNTVKHYHAKSNKQMTDIGYKILSLNGMGLHDHPYINPVKRKLDFHNSSVENNENVFGMDYQNTL